MKWEGQRTSSNVEDRRSLGRGARVGGGIGIGGVVIALAAWGLFGINPMTTLGVINNVTDTMTGLEFGPVNLAGACVGAQVGALNIASHTVGLQLGVLNFTGDLHGVQLGILNFSGSGGAIVFPILNLGF